MRVIPMIDETKQKADPKAGFAAIEIRRLLHPQLAAIFKTLIASKSCTPPPTRTTIR
jgi:hypothetical protein